MKVTRYNCPHCDYYAVFKENLGHHLENVHPTMKGKPVNTPQGTPGRPAPGVDQMTRTYCEVCQYDYRNRPGYLAHECVSISQEELHKRLSEHVKINNELHDENNELKVKLANTRANWEILNNENSELLARLQMSNNDVDKLHAIIATKDETIEGYKQDIIFKDHLNKAYGKVGICGDTVYGIGATTPLTCTLPAGHAGWHQDDNGASWTHTS